MARLPTGTALTLMLLAGSMAPALGDTGGTTGVMTTTPRAKTDDALGTQGNTTRTGDVGGLPLSAGVETWGPETRGQIVGRTLYGGNDQEIGEITDIITRQGLNTPEALVSVGEDMGMGERQVVVPFDRVRVADDRLVTDLTQDQIAGMGNYNATGYGSWNP